MPISAFYDADGSLDHVELVDAEQDGSHHDGDGARTAEVGSVGEHREGFAPRGPCCRCADRAGPARGSVALPLWLHGGPTPRNGMDSGRAAGRRAGRAVRPPSSRQSWAAACWMAVDQVGQAWAGARPGSAWDRTAGDNAPGGPGRCGLARCGDPRGTSADHDELTAHGSPWLAGWRP